MSSVILNKKIIPRTMIYNQEIYDIVYVDPKMIINNYEIILDDFKLVGLKLFNPHPNCNPKTNEFCLGSNIIGQKIEKIKSIFDYMLSVYNIDSCYFSPWGLINYIKREDVSI